MKNNLLCALSQTVVFFLMITFSFECYATGVNEEMIEIGRENVQLNIHSNKAGVYYLITDPQGRRVGYDVALKQYVREFPAAFGFDLETFARDESESFIGEAMFNLIPGAYRMDVFGDGLTDFVMAISISRRIQGQGFVNFELNGITDKDVSISFKLIYNSDPEKPAGVVSRLVAPKSLIQDITLSRKIGWIDNDGIINSLVKKVEAVEASIAKGNSETARNQLNALINEVNAQKGKHIADKAAKILLEDIQYIMDGLAK